MEYYKKVYIKSAEDLPKKDGSYFYKRKNTSDRGTGVFVCIGKIDKDFWLKNIDWYLLPVPEIQMPGEEEINARGNSMKFMSNHIYDSKSYIDGAKWFRDEVIKRNK